MIEPVKAIFSPAAGTFFSNGLVGVILGMRIDKASGEYALSRTNVGRREVRQRRRTASGIRLDVYRARLYRRSWLGWRG